MKNTCREYCQARREVPDQSQLRLGPMATMWTLSGFPSPTSGLQAPARPVLDRESQRILLVLTPTNRLEKDDSSGDLINKDSDLQQAQTDYEYLTVNGLEIWILDFIFCVEFEQSVGLFAKLWTHFVQLFDHPTTTLVIQHSVFGP